MSDIDYLDFNVGRISKLALAAQEIADQSDEEVETAIVIVRDTEGHMRVYYLKDRDEVVGMLARAQFLMMAGNRKRDINDDDDED